MTNITVNNQEIVVHIMQVCLIIKNDYVFYNGLISSYLHNYQDVTLNLVLL
jgi:hypothetical protein